MRRLLDPIQADLIPAHVTLCREDVIGHLSSSEIERKLAGSAAQPVTLRFGRPVLFEGHGLMLPCIYGEEPFQALREQVLSPARVRRHAPHITLAHPRNPKSEHNCLVNALGQADECTLTFPSFQLIEQVDGAPWRLPREFRLGAERPRGSWRS